MVTRRKREEYDWGKPPIWRAAIYLCELKPSETDGPRNQLPIDSQRELCRCVAAALHAEVVGEFVDDNPFAKPRPELARVLELADQDQRLNYLIVSSRVRLASDADEAFDIAWRLGFAKTVVISANAEDDFPWTGATRRA